MFRVTDKKILHEFVMLAFVIIGEQYLPFYHVSLWHIVLSQLISEKPQTMEVFRKPSRSFPFVRNIYIC